MLTIHRMGAFTKYIGMECFRTTGLKQVYETDSDTDREELSLKLHKNMFQAFRTEQRSNLQPQAKPGVRADIPPAPYNSSPPLSTLASQ